MELDSAERELLRRLVQAGAMLQDNGFEGESVLRLPQHAEIIELLQGAPDNRLLYYVEAGAPDQHATHGRKFDRVEIVHGRDLDFSLHGKSVAYVAPFAQWPEMSADEMAEMLAVCRHDVEANDEACERWRRFVGDNRPCVGTEGAQCAAAETLPPT